jgi:hypothetical protein
LKLQRGGLSDAFSANATKGGFGLKEVHERARVCELKCE